MIADARVARLRKALGDKRSTIFSFAESSSGLAVSVTEHQRGWLTLVRKGRQIRHAQVTLRPGLTGTSAEGWFSQSRQGVLTYASGLIEQFR